MEVAMNYALAFVAAILVYQMSFPSERVYVEFEGEILHAVQFPEDTRLRGDTLLRRCDPVKMNGIADSAQEECAAAWDELGISFPEPTAGPDCSIDPVREEFLALENRRALTLAALTEEIPCAPEFVGSYVPSVKFKYESRGLFQIKNITKYAEHSNGPLHIYRILSGSSTRYAAF